MRFFMFPVMSLVVGLAIAGIISWSQTSDWVRVWQSLLTVLLLSVLEISLSFDNAVVNATVLKKMSEVWRRRFLTWGMLIAVFGMRLIFPLVIVSITGGVSIWESFMMALNQPKEYSEMMMASHLAVSSFGGAFLLMVFLHFFMNDEKDIHWIPFIEKNFIRAARIKSSELLISLLVLIVVYKYLPNEQGLTFLVSAIWGLITFILVHGFSELLEETSVSQSRLLSSGFGLFLYLEVLDSSFSFDGVVGAFAISHEILIIMLGLSIGAFFVRGITLYLVEKDTLKQFIFLEHGAFYALGALAFFMLLDPFFHFAEWLTAVAGAAILVFSVLWSIYIDRPNRT